MPTKIGVILSGCGVFDGSEIHEAVATLLAIDRHGATYQCLAPDIQFNPVDHLAKLPAQGETRSVLVEAARIARGNILDLAKVKGTDFDGFVLPGGFGAVTNLCSFATDGPNCKVDPQIARILMEAHAAARPIGFICIAPAIAAKIFGASLHPQLTIGHDAATSGGLAKLGAQHVECDAAEVVVDKVNRIISTPAYMEAKSIKEVFSGIDKLIEELLAMVHITASVA